MILVRYSLRRTLCLGCSCPMLLYVIIAKIGAIGDDEGGGASIVDVNVPGKK